MEPMDIVGKSKEDASLPKGLFFGVFVSLGSFRFHFIFILCFSLISLNFRFLVVCLLFIFQRKHG